MLRRVALGEVILALFFAALGLLWVIASLRMPLWEGFAPQSGFMPLWYGIILVALSGLVIVNLLRQKEAPSEQPIGKPLMVLVSFAAVIVGLSVIGFGPAVFLFLLFLFALVERLPILTSLLVAAATTAILFLIFRTWLGVQLPIGPLGI